ncbi:MAG: CTP synthase [Candidatus Lloydbacteria bacterium RIFCSPHIGHO2_01_FULL_41_20]|uniref:CTP synthase n=1 Tax=Candidatus Lloydbacteria bacterium RIFCSPHIGHO2_01_FULL_41_20 TaxID=1798657 RepID=A0A1G2CS49_9BACT|nr:MAG: CTP synthase [Candidatus Lloydbacteria bacterium RIFCSPHIGHO2_01_FULL_41_20]
MAKKSRKYIFVVGGVISGVGKGITVSSIGKILQSRGLKVTAIKIDPYVNVDAGTMNPTEHGEVYVLDDGDECDQDMGNYERFLDITLTRQNYMTTGRVYQSVINKERNLEYGGKCVQVVPHIPQEIISRIEKAGVKADADVVVVEIGGTVGEYENILFLETARMMKLHAKDDVMFVMVSYVPVPRNIGEMKTKPTQHAVRNLNAAGIQPDIIIARSVVPLDQKRKDKLALFCNVSSEAIISAPDVENIYEVPVNFEKDHLGNLVLKLLNLPKRGANGRFGGWQRFAKKIKSYENGINIAIVGKYFDTGDFTLSDSYISVIEAVKYSAFHLKRRPKLTWLNSKDFERNPRKLQMLSNFDGIIVPGGFGGKGIEGKLKVIEYARTKKIPYLGLCYGMQLAMIEYARNVLKIKDANTAEIKPKGKHLVIDVMPEQKAKLKMKNYGGSMRLGSYKAILKEGTIAKKAYGGTKVIFERHRHRYEVNPQYLEKLEKAGMVFSGVSPDGILMEIAELSQKDHPFFVGTQFHPEFKARPLSPHPLFSEFMRSAIKRSQ